MVLDNTGFDDASFMQKRIEFCTEYIKRSKDMKDENIGNMKLAIANSYFDLGRREKSDAIFESYLLEDPKWGWCWISWSDCYWISHKNTEEDYPKAEAILKKALNTQGLRDKEDVLERLLEFYVDTVKSEEAMGIERELNKLGKSKTSYKNILQLISSAKIGRNDFCSCGSGKKYKKCCGKNN
jgi:tetratricopeptide (TPR) repeat protein